jgi:hypothetical protein
MHAAYALKTYRKYQEHAAKFVTTSAVASLLTTDREKEEGVLQALPVSHLATIVGQVRDMTDFVQALSPAVRETLCKASGLVTPTTDSVLTFIVEQARRQTLPLSLLEKASKEARQRRIAALHQRFPIGTRVELLHEGERQTGRVKKAMRRKVRIVLDRDPFVVVSRLPKHLLLKDAK